MNIIWFFFLQVGINLQPQLLHTNIWIIKKKFGEDKADIQRISSRAICPVNSRDDQFEPSSSQDARQIAVTIEEENKHQ